MKQSNKQSAMGKKGKVAIISALYTATVLIITSGVYFTVYSFLNDVNFKVLNTSVPGFVFGLLVGYFGIRYFLLVGKLKNEILKSTAVFSWSNFKRSKRLKNR